MEEQLLAGLAGVMPPAQMYVVFAAFLAIAGTVLTNISRDPEASRRDLDRMIVLLFSTASFGAAIHIAFVLILMSIDTVGQVRIHQFLHGGLVLFAASAYLLWANARSAVSSHL